MTAEELKIRTNHSAHRCLDVVDALPGKSSAKVLGGQLCRFTTSVGTNYRAACRARSKAEFIAKLGTVEEETDETIFWLEIIAERNILPAKRLDSLIGEANELTAIIVASKKTAKT